MRQNNLLDRRWLPPLVMAGVIVAFFSHVIFPIGSQVLPADDFVQQFYPWFTFVARSVTQDGVIPLWNPHQFLGHSTVANPQYGMTYPLNWLVFLRDPAHVEEMLGLLIVIHALLAGWGMYVLVRLWGANSAAAVLAGILMATGGYFAARVRAGHYSMILVYTWMPWVLAGLRLAVQRRRPLWAVPGGMALGLALLGGYPQLVYFLIMAIGVQWGYELLIAGDRAARVRLTRQFVLVGVIGLVLGAANWLPVMDYAPQTERGQAQPLSFANQMTLPAHKLITLLIPNFFGARIESETPPGYWGEIPHYEEAFAYAGVLPLLIVLLLPQIKQRRLWMFGTVALLGVLLSLGFDGVLWLALYRWVPLVRSLRAPPRAMALTSIALIGLLALVITHLMRLSLDQRRELLRPLVSRVIPVGLVILWTVALLLTGLGTGLEPGEQAERVAYMAEQLALAGVFWLLAGFALWAWTAEAGTTAARYALAITLGVAVLDMWHITWQLTNTEELEPSRIWTATAEVVPQDAEAGYGRVFQMTPPPGIPNGPTLLGGYYSPQGYDAIAPKTWAELYYHAIEDPGNAVNRLFGVRYALSAQDISNYGFVNVLNFQLIGERAPYLFYENPDALPRAYVAQRYEVEPNDKMAVARVVMGHVSDGALVLLPSDPGCLMSGQGGTAEITQYGPNEIMIDVQADGPGLLVLSDQYDSDWKAEIDGKPADLLRANTALRGVCLPGGNHTVRFVYRPWALYVGGGLSLIGWLVALPAVGWLWRSLRRRALAVEDANASPEKEAG